MQIGVVSDTHGHLKYANRAVSVLRELDIAEVLHCGDIGSTSVIDLFKQWPTHFVFGNVDHEEETLKTAIEEAGQTCHDRFGSLELEGKRIALLHSDNGKQFQETIASGQWDLVCYGHTHVAKQEQINGTLVLNPGALYRANRHSIAVVDLPTLDVSHIDLE